MRILIIVEKKISQKCEDQYSTNFERILPQKCLSEEIRLILHACNDFEKFYWSVDDSLLQISKNLKKVLDLEMLKKLIITKIVFDRIEDDHKKNCKFLPIRKLNFGDFAEQLNIPRQKIYDLIIRNIKKLKTESMTVNQKLGLVHRNKKKKFKEKSKPGSPYSGICERIDQYLPNIYFFIFYQHVITNKTRYGVKYYQWDCEKAENEIDEKSLNDMLTYALNYAPFRFMGDPFLYIQCPEQLWDRLNILNTSYDARDRFQKLFPQSTKDSTLDLYFESNKICIESTKRKIFEKTVYSQKIQDKCQKIEIRQTLLAAPIEHLSRRKEELLQNLEKTGEKSVICDLITCKQCGQKYSASEFQYNPDGFAICQNCGLEFDPDQIPRQTEITESRSEIAIKKESNRKSRVTTKKNLQRFNSYIEQNGDISGKWHARIGFFRSLFAVSDAFITEVTKMLKFLYVYGGNGNEMDGRIIATFLIVGIKYRIIDRIVGIIQEEYIESLDKIRIYVERAVEKIVLLASNDKIAKSFRVDRKCPEIIFNFLFRTKVFRNNQFEYDYNAYYFYTVINLIRQKKNDTLQFFIPIDNNKITQIIDELNYFDFISKNKFDISNNLTYKLQRTINEQISTFRPQSIFVKNIIPFISGCIEKLNISIKPMKLYCFWICHQFFIKYTQLNGIKEGNSLSFKEIKEFAALFYFFISHIPGIIGIPVVEFQKIFVLFFEMDIEIDPLYDRPRNKGFYEIIDILTIELFFMSQSAKKVNKILQTKHMYLKEHPKFKKSESNPTITKKLEEFDGEILNQTAQITNDEKDRMNIWCMLMKLHISKRISKFYIEFKNIAENHIVQRSNPLANFQNFFSIMNNPVHI